MSHSSPFSRPVLTTKESNVLSSSPNKSIRSRSNSIGTNGGGGSPTKKSKLSPTKFTRSSVNSNTSRSTSPKKGKLNFTIYEDKVDYTTNELTGLQVNDITKDGQENYSINKHANNNNTTTKTNEQENILQPKYKTLPQDQMGMVRRPLQDLSIQSFKGFISQGEDHIEPLTEPFVPKNFKNESNSIHKFYNNYPSYISPMKSNSKFLFRSGLHVIHDAKENEFNEDDELEQKLLRKLMMMKKHKRSFSLGKNDLKSNLIKKNGFTILSN